MVLTKSAFCRVVWCALAGCLLAVLGGLLLLSGSAATALGGCSSPYDPGNGWKVEICTTDPNVTTPMDVVLEIASPSACGGMVSQ